MIIFTAWKRIFSSFYIIFSLHFYIAEQQIFFSPDAPRLSVVDLAVAALDRINY